MITCPLLVGTIQGGSKDSSTLHTHHRSSLGMDSEMFSRAQRFVSEVVLHRLVAYEPLDYNSVCPQGDSLGCSRDTHTTEPLVLSDADSADRYLYVASIQIRLQRVCLGRRHRRKHACPPKQVAY